MRPLTILEAEHIAHRLAVELMDYTTEPIPAFDTRYPHKLESCLEQPFQCFAGNDLYEGLYRKAAVLFYLVTKNHPFQNGNKRMAVTLTLTFLYRNEVFLEMPTEVLYKIALSVAENDDQLSIEAAVDQLSDIFERYAKSMLDN